MKTYYTKCGREFQKSTDVSVTAYKMAFDDKECPECPFQIEVKKGYPGEFDHCECRAGSQPPSQIDDWRGSVEDKNSLSIRSLHNDFLESVLEYCKEQPELNAGYNQDLSDCRRQISVSCSSNKKGMAAKKALIKKFFDGNGKEETHDETSKEKIDKLWATYVKCEACKHIIDEGDSVEYCKCAKKRGHIKREQTACDKFEGLEEKEVEKVNCNIKECLINDENGGCGYSENDSKSSLFKEYAEGAIKLGCKNENLKEALNNLNAPTKRKPREIVDGVCEEMREDCSFFCKHNDGCAALLTTGEAKVTFYENYPNIDCEVYRQNAPKTTESVNELAEIDTKTSEIVTFDYSTVDVETAEFLHDKANKITEIRIKSVIAMGKELKEAQDRLANNGNGTFEKWVNDLNMSDQTARNYINGYEWIGKNFAKLEDAENIQTSLLFAASKPSAPKELQDQVLCGDITTHKQYKEKETEWKEKLEQYRSQQDTLRTEKQQASIKAMDADRRAGKLETEAEELRDQLEELQNQKTESQDTKTISDLQNKIIELENQLKDKPIETSAVQIVEKVPEKDAVEISLRLYGTLMAAKLISKQEIQIVRDTANEVRKNSIAEFLENLRDIIPGYLDILNDNVPVRKCEECEFCSWDGLKEDDEANGLIFCTHQSASGEPRLSRNDSPCHLFKER